MPSLTSQLHIEPFLIDSSRKLVDEGLKYIGESNRRVNLFLDRTFGESSVKACRASRIVSRAMLQNQYFLTEERATQIIHQLSFELHESILFNFMYLFAESDLPQDEELQGRLLDFSFQVLDRFHAISSAVLQFSSAKIIYKFSLIFVELQNELRIRLEELIPHGKPSFVYHGKRILMALDTKKGA